MDLAAIAHHLPDGVVVALPSGAIRFASERAIGLSGLESLEGRSIFEIVWPDDKAVAYGFFRALLDGADPPPRDLRIDHRGSPLFTEWNGRLMADPSGAPAFVVLVLREAELRRQSEQRLAAAVEEAAETNRELREALRALESAAMTDTLTGTYNRRHFDTQARAEMARQHRYGQPVSLVMVDIDRFKTINDSQGHGVGDQILVRVARAMERALRASDSLYRWGGDELVVLAPGIGGTAALRLAERLRTAVEATPMPGTGRVTLSAGAASLVPWEKADAWLRRADAALYRAKEAGRNRSELAPRPSDAPPERIVQLVWDEAYECGDLTIDLQHRELFQLGNAVLDEAFGADPKGRLEARLATLVAYLLTHFADEEAILARIGFPGAEAHARMHRQLAGEAAGVQEAVRLGAGSTLGLVDFIVRRVVAEHLFTADRVFFPFVRDARGEA